MAWYDENDDENQPMPPMPTDSSAWLMPQAQGNPQGLPAQTSSTGGTMYRGQSYDSIDPGFQDRLSQLQGLRNSMLGQQSARNDWNYGANNQAISLAGMYATAGGVQKNALPNAQPYVNNNNRYTDNQNKLDSDRIGYAENDENRISKMVRDNYANAKSEEEKNYTRAWNEDDRAYKRGRDDIADARYTDERDYKRGRDDIADAKDDRAFDFTKSRAEAADTRDDRNFNYRKERDDSDDEYKEKEFGMREKEFSQRSKMQDAELAKSTRPQTLGVVQDGNRNRIVLQDPQTGRYFYGDNPTEDAKAEHVLQAKAPGSGAGTGTYGGTAKTTEGRIDDLLGQGEAAKGVLERTTRLRGLFDKINEDGWGPDFGTGPISNMADGLQKYGNALTGGYMFQDAPYREEAKQAIAELKVGASALLKGQGSITEGERAMLAETLPDLGKTAEANNKILDVMERVATRARDKSLAWQDAYKNGQRDFNSFSSNYDQRTGFGMDKGGNNTSPGNAGGIPQPRSEQEYKALPPGSTYLDPNGTVRTKGNG